MFLIPKDLFSLFDRNLWYSDNMTQTKGWLQWQPRVDLWRQLFKITLKEVNGGSAWNTKPWAQFFQQTGSIRFEFLHRQGRDFCWEECCTVLAGDTLGQSLSDSRHARIRLPNWLKPPGPIDVHRGQSIMVWWGTYAYQLGSLERPEQRRKCT